MSSSIIIPTKIAHTITPPVLSKSNSLISSSTTTTTSSSSSTSVVAVGASQIPTTPTKKPLNCIKHNHLGTYFMTCGNDRLIHLYNATSGAHIKQYAAHGYEVTDLVMSRDNTRFASVGGDKSVFYWDVASGVTVRRFAGHYAKLNAIEMAGSTAEQQSGGGGEVLVSASFDATVRLWDTKSQSTVPIQTLSEAKDSVTCLYTASSSSYPVIVTGSVDGCVRTYDLRKGLLTTDQIGHPVTSIKQTRDGETMLVASLDSTVRLLDKRNGALLVTYKGHENTKYRVPAVFGRHEKHVAAGSEDGKVVLWDIESGEKVGECQGHHGKVVSGVSISQKTGQMITCGTDGEVVLWT